MRHTPALMVAALLLLGGGGPPAAAQFDNGQSTQFGTITLPPFPTYEGTPRELVARVVLRDGHAYQEATRVHFSWILVSGGMDVTFDGLTTDNGTPIRLAADERGADKLRVQVRPEDLPPPGQAILMHATARLGETGLFHLGALVMAFDQAYKRVDNADESPAELYGYAQLRNTVVADGLLRPPFVGQGNANGVLVFGASLALAVFLGARWAVGRWTRGPNPDD